MHQKFLLSAGVDLLRAYQSLAMASWWARHSEPSLTGRVNDAADTLHQIYAASAAIWAEAEHDPISDIPVGPPGPEMLAGTLDTQHARGCFQNALDDAGRLTASAIGYLGAAADKVGTGTLCKTLSMWRAEHLNPLREALARRGGPNP